MASNQDPGELPGTSHKPASRAPSTHGSESDTAQADTPRPTTATRPTSTRNIRRDYGTLGVAEAGTIRRRAPPPARAPNSPSARRQDTIERPISPELPLLSPQTSRTRPRPSTLRRQSSTKPGLPHKGQRFSVDDDASEVDEDQGDERERDEPRRDFPPMTKTNTLRRRTIRVPNLARVDSAEEDSEDQKLEREDLRRPQQEPEATLQEQGDDDMEELTAAEADDDEDSALSDAESFTLKDRQLAINETHPFGIRIWKPALYKKDRSVEKNADADIHSSPSQIMGTWLKIFNCLWTIIFGWWLAALCVLAAGVTMLFCLEASASEYASTFWGLAGYLFWPFGQFVKLEQDDNYAEEDEGEGRSIGEYERWQTGDLEYGRLMFGPSVTYVGSIIGRHRDSIGSADETDSLLGRTPRLEHNETIIMRKRRIFGRGQWTVGRIVFFGLFYVVVAPMMLLVSAVCWFLVFFIPMGRVLTILFHHIRMRPLALTFHSDVSYARGGSKPSSIILCTYRAAGLKYWKYTVDGTNIFLINFCSIVGFVIIDYFLVKEALGVQTWATNDGLLFCLALLSIIPLAYFIGQAVASISAQSTMGLGAVINAFFSTLVEVFLYCVALNQGKGRLVEGSIIGSIFAGILLLPGMSMCAGAINRKTQRFNVKSSTATSTLLLFAMIAQFGPTLFYKIYGAHELICKTCSNDYDPSQPRDCRQCYFRQIPAPNDDFFQKAVRPYTWFAAVLLFLSYTIGLLFTLRTHAATIWYTDLDEKKPQPTTNAPTVNPSPSDTRHQSVVAQQALNMSNSFKTSPAIRESQMYKRLVNKTLHSAGMTTQENAAEPNPSIPEHGPFAHDYASENVYKPPPKPTGASTPTSPHIQPTVASISSLSAEDNQLLFRQVAELASTAATVATRDALRHPQATSYMTNHSSIKQDKRRPAQATRLDTMFHAGAVKDAAAAANVPVAEVEGDHAVAGHDAPNWSRTKSTIILLVATCAYAAIAEVLVDTVDVILSSVDIDEKFLGMTLFALVPNTTEFLNAISFAMNGNVALSMEIGAAYVLQVALLQIPALVLYSSVFEQFRAGSFTGEIADFTFNLIFPQWDMVTVILCVFLLSYVNSEGKSNYFKGSVLVLTYLVILLGFYYSGFTGIDVLGVDPNDTLALTVSNWESLRRVGGGRAALGREL